MAKTRVADEDDEGPRPGEVAVAMPERFDAGLHYIGVIHTPWKHRIDCPKNGRGTDAPCTIELFEPYQAALEGIQAFSHLVVIYFMNKARRDLVLQVPSHLGIARGTFALRSPVRPNPIAISVARLVKLEGRRLTVVGLDCLDGTPLLDLKPYLPTVDAAPDDRNTNGR